MSDLDPLILKLQRAKLPYGIARDRADMLDRVKGPRAALDRAAEEFFASLAPPAPAPRQGEPGRAGAQSLPATGWLDGRVRADSLIASLEAAAKARAAALYPMDAMHSLVVTFAHEAHKQWWYERPAGLVVGILRTEPDVIQTLKKGGVLLWEGTRTSSSEILPPDDMWRLVNVNWLTAHEDIFQFVIDSTPMGRRCRFCLITEPSDSGELKPVELERRHGRTVVNGVVSLVPGAMHTHDACRRFWLDWLELASRYQSREKAQEADAAAGRKPREGKVTIPRIDLEQPLSGTGDRRL
jgi:hypothetical protein